MNLQEKIFKRVAKYFKKEFGDLGFKIYEGDSFYNEYSSPKVKMSMLSDTDGINITMFGGHEEFATVNIHVDSLDDFDVFLDSIPDLAEAVSVGITLMGKGTETVDYNFKPKDTQILPHLVKIATVKSKK